MPRAATLSSQRSGGHLPPWGSCESSASAALARGSAPTLTKRAGAWLSDRTVAWAAFLSSGNATQRARSFCATGRFKLLMRTLRRSDRRVPSSRCPRHGRRSLLGVLGLGHSRSDSHSCRVQVSTTLPAIFRPSLAQHRRGAQKSARARSGEHLRGQRGRRCLAPRCIIARCWLIGLAATRHG